MATASRADRVWRAKRFKLALGTVLVALAIALGLHWWLQPTALSSVERPLLGTWQHALNPTAGAPSGFTKVWSFTENRSCRIEVVDAGSGKVLDTLAGRWSVRDGTLVCDWEGNPVARAGRALPRT